MPTWFRMWTMRSSAFHYCTALLVVAAPVVASAFQAPPPKPAPAARARTARRRGAAQGRHDPAVGPGVQGAAAGHRHRPSRQPPTWSPCTTRAGPPTARCSTARVARNAPSDLPARPGDQGLGRGRAADGRRREAPPLDSRRRWPTRASRAGRPGMLVFDVELLEHDAVAHRAAARRRRAARRRQDDRLGPGLQGAEGGHRHRPPARATAASPCTTPAGRPTARCSTAR